MASVKAKDIPEEQQMWTDIWNWRKKYYYPEDKDEWWEDMIQSSINLGEKYNTTLCKKIIYAILDDLKARGKDGKDVVQQ